jgi:hypothetical protein
MAGPDGRTYQFLILSDDLWATAEGMKPFIDRRVSGFERHWPVTDISGYGAIGVSPGRAVCVCNIVDGLFEVQVTGLGADPAPVAERLMRLLADGE